MAGPIYKDRVQEISTTIGVGPYSLSGAVVGYQTFAAVGDGNTCYYAATDGRNWEVGLGTYTLINARLARTSILASSNGGSAVIWPEGTKYVWVDYPADAIAAAGSGTVTAVSVATANGFAGSSSGGTTPELTLSTTVTGILQANGTSMSALVGTAGYALIGNGVATPTFKGFVQSGTGASTRTWNAKVAEQLSVTDFGATGDGTTNDAPAIQAALAVADTVEGGEVQLPVPASHFQISSAVTLDGTFPVTLIGSGQPELRTDFAGAAISVGTGPATEQGFVTLKDFKLWGDLGSITGIRGQYAVNLLLDGLSLYQIGTLGVYLSDCYTFLVDRCQFNQCGDAGLYLTKASMNRGIVSRSKFVNHDGVGQCGISIESGGSPHYGGVITGTDFEFNTVGIRCADISGLHITDCYFEENDTHILATTTCDNLTITDCVFLGPGVVDLSDVDGVTLDNLVFFGTGTVLDLTGCTNVQMGRLSFPNGGTIAGLNDQRLVGWPIALDSALSQNPRLQVHTTDGTRPASAFYRWSADNGGPSFSFTKSRGATPGTHTIVQSGDSLGSVIWRGADGSGNFWNSASIGGAVDGTPGVGDMPGRLVFNTAADGSTSLVERMRIDSRGFSSLTGSFGRGAPVTKTADFTVADTENYLINNKSGSTCTVTLPSASAWTGREVILKTIQAQTTVSASSNVVPLTGGAAGTAILSANAGRWAKLVSNGTNWEIMAGVV